jgi:hypothetical protein
MIRRIAVTAFFCLWHSGVQAVAEPVRIAYAEVFPAFRNSEPGRPRDLLWTSSALRLRAWGSM